MFLLIIHHRGFCLFVCFVVVVYLFIYSKHLLSTVVLVICFRDTVENKTDMTPSSLDLIFGYDMPIKQPRSEYTVISGRQKNT